MNDGIAKSFQKLLQNPDLALQFIDLFPFPVEVFAPDGTSVFINRAIMKQHGIADADLIVGKYNLLNDPVCNDQMGLREGIQRAFLRGEEAVWYDIEMPVQDLLDRGVIDEKPFEKSFSDLYLYPVKSGDKLACVVFIQIFKKLYYGKSELAEVKAYMDSHWKEAFNLQAVMQYANLGKTQLYNLFNKYSGMTPGGYYRQNKVEHLKKTLADKNLSVKEAFAECGENSRGAYAKIFKKLTGLSPAKYRESLL